MKRKTNSKIIPLFAALLSLSLPLLGQEVSTDFSNYAAEEEIIVTFSDGPGNPKDWVGLYKQEMVAGEDSSLAYVDGTETGTEGLTEGELTFADGMTDEGIYEARFFEDNGYTLLAKAVFTVGDVGPTVKTDKAVYTPGEPIVVDFLVGPGNPKDWVGLYKVGMVPGNVGSLAWFYVDGTKDGNEGVEFGTLTFEGGMTDEGDYRAVFFENDGYTVLADTEFEVQQPAPETPKVVSISPQDGDKNADPAIAFTATIRNGTTSLKSDSVKLTLDGKALDATVTAGDEGFNTITFSGEGLFVAGSNHRFMLEFTDDGDPATSESVSVEIDVAAYVELELPEAIYFENFDSVEEFEMPDGWEGVNLSQEINAELEPDDFTSAYYEGWVNVAMTRWSNSGSAAQKATQPAPPIFVNGTRQVLTGNALVADSASRNGHFLTFVYTKDFDLSNHKDVHLGFYSHYAQNQDSSGSVEYSIDEGETWLPIVYMLDQADIVRDDEGNVDAVTTLEQEHADIAVGYDPDTFEEVGGYYGAYIGAEISEALAPYISGRINDNQTESKRYELFRLPEADGEKTVRFRLAKSGTYSLSLIHI